MDQLKYPLSSLYITEDLKISEKEYTFVQALHPQFKKQVLKQIHNSMRITFIRNMDEFFTSNVCCLPAFLVLYYYPCILRDLLPSNPYILSNLLEFCDCDNEEVISAIIGCMGNFFTKLDVETLKNMKWNSVIQVLKESSSPEAAVHQRLAVCDFLSGNKMLLSVKPTCFSGK